MAGKNVAAGSVPFFVGCGAYKHHVPASVDHLIQRSEFLTSYTPYQPEIAQGTLHYLFEFQTQVALLTGMEVANASMYDGSTATAEAVLMAHRVTKRKKAVLARQPASALSSRRSRRCRGSPATSWWRCRRRMARPRILTGMIDDERLLRRGAERRTCSGSCATCGRLAEKAHAAGALLIAVVTEAVSLGLVDAAGRDGRRHRGRRGPVDRQWR